MRLMRLIVNDTDPWPRKCSRCSKTIENIEHWHAGHGWDIFCDECEESYKMWFERGSYTLKWGAPK